MARVARLDLLIFSAVAACAAGLAWMGTPWGLVAMICGPVILGLGYHRAWVYFEDRAREAGHRHTTFGEWTVLILILVVGGTALSFSPRLRPDIVVLVLAMIGGGVWLLAASLRQTYRDRRKRGAPARLEGGRDFRVRWNRFALTAFACWASGATAYIFWEEEPVQRTALGIAVGLAGALAPALLVAPLLRRRLRFDPHGITFGRSGYEFKVPWDILAGVNVIEVGTPRYGPAPKLVVLYLTGTKLIQVAPESARPKVLLRMKLSRLGSSAPFYTLHIEPTAYGFGIEPLVSALERYIRNPPDRSELDPGYVQRQTHPGFNG